MKKVYVVFIILLSILGVLIFAFGFNQMSESSGDEMLWYALVVVGLTVVGASIFLLAVIGSYKKKLRGEIYPIDKYTTLELTAESDIYSHSHTTSYRYRSNKKK